MFSSRLPGRIAPNALSLAAGRARASGGAFFDLTETNPTAVGLKYPRDLLVALADPAGAAYRPEPSGLAEARAAVAASYQDDAVDPDSVVLTASTSEAYAFLFKLLCDPGDEVLTPQPSYPLFDLLTSLEGVTPVPYRLDPAGAWTIDRDSVERALSSRTRALLVVSPNNPTGSMLRRADRDWLAALAAARGLALIADEVFADYPIAPSPDAASLRGERRALTFTLGGLSKSAGLPQVKLAWTIVSGRPDLVADARARLEIIADTYLSVSTPVQIAAARLIEGSRLVRDEIRARVAHNLARLRALVRACPSLTLVEPEGGWSAVLRVPALASEEAIALRLIEDARVLVHPGYFFDFAEEAYLVLSLLPDPARFDEATTRLADVLVGSPV